ncbi:MFS transporter, partial [Streptomyces rubrogriseus]|nr:MFS transporter [Streptomyces rubrogriseus]
AGAVAAAAALVPGYRRGSARPAGGTGGAAQSSSVSSELPESSASSES